MLVNRSMLIGILLLGLFGFSCKKELNKEEYSAYVSDPENGLRKDQTVGGFELSAMYEPADLIIAKRDIKDAKEWKSEYETFEHFQFRIKLKEGGNILMYHETAQKNEVSRINHFSFEAKEDFMILSGQDTSKCKLAIYSRNYNLQPTIDLTLTFDKIEKKSDWQLIYSDQQFDIGKVKFLFRQEDLNNIPDLKL